MADALDMITGAYLRQQEEHAADRQAMSMAPNVVSPTQMSSAPAPQQQTQPLGNAVPNVPDLFAREQPGAMPMSADRAPVGQTAAPASTQPGQLGLDPNVIAQALTLQSALMGDPNSILSNLMGAFGVQQTPFPVQGINQLGQTRPTFNLGQIFDLLAPELQALPAIQSYFQPSNPFLAFNPNLYGGPAQQAIAAFLSGNMGQPGA